MDVINGYGILYEPEPNSGCWLWHGSNVKGYAYGRVDGKKQYIHRFLWEASNGPIPDGMFACHKCDTPGCVNPNHIFIGTPADNSHDRDLKGRQVSLRKIPKSHIPAIAASGASVNALSKMYGVHESRIRYIRRTHINADDE